MRICFIISDIGCNQYLQESKRKTAGVLPIGNEILSGRTQDTNSSWIAKRLGERGIRLSEIRVIPDDEDRIISSLNEFRGRYDYVITTGGIGPTHDDITAACIAKALGRALLPNAQARQILLDYYGGNDEELTPPRLKMTMIPDGARLIHNPVSGAPGFHIDNIFTLAGIPQIMKAMMEYVLEEMAPGQPFLSKIIESPRSEGQIAEQLTKIQEQFPDVDIGSYPAAKDGKFSVNLIVRGQDEDRLNDAETAIRMMLVSL